MLDTVKKALRVNAQIYDSEINALIIAARADIDRVGICENSYNFALVRQAIILYCKANFGFNEDSEKYAAAYEKQLATLALSKMREGMEMLE